MEKTIVKESTNLVLQEVESLMSNEQLVSIELRFRKNFIFFGDVGFELDQELLMGCEVEAAESDYLNSLY